MSSHPQDYLVSTCFDFGGRDIGVTVEHDGFSYWFDRTGAKRAIQKKSDVSRLAAFFGDKESAEYVSRVDDEHTIRVPIPEADLKLIRDKLSPQYWADSESGNDKNFELEKALDKILEPLFWEYVNPLLSPPCTRD